MKRFTPPYSVNLYASQEDTERFKSFYGPSKEIFQGKNVQNISMKDVSRLASATNARAALSKKDSKGFYSLLPDIAEQSKEVIFRRLSK